MKIETIENEKQTEWIVPCLVKYYLGGAIVLVTSASHDGFYSGFGVNTGDRYSIGDEYDSISPPRWLDSI